MQAPLGLLTIMIMDANTIRFNIAIGIPSIKFIQTKNVSKSKAFR